MRIPPRFSRRATVPALAIVVATPWIAPATCASKQAPLTETERTVHLLSRTTYGVRPGDVQEVLRTGSSAWLERQLHPERIDDAALEARLAAAAEATERTLHGVRIGRPRAAAQDTTMANRMRAETMRVEALVRLRIIAFVQPHALVNAKMERAVRSKRQLEEVMTDFWFNHFNVYFAKGRVRTVVGDYERDAIRPHVFGRFEDMLRATAQHPAMLIYLDNALSSAADPAGQGQKGGLNENYARELLELHTLGVDGGYTQRDVIEVARALTGWTVGSPPGERDARVFAATGEFEFQLERHDRGEKVVLGLTLPAGRGIEDGLDVLHILAVHPSTARFIATKLVRHFVADEPPPELIMKVADVFEETDGDLREVTRALFTDDRFYHRSNYRAKTKRPFEFVASALRVTGAEVVPGRELYNQLRAFGHVPYNEAAPTGFPTEASEWLSAGAVLGRINFAMDLAAGGSKSARFSPESAFGYTAPFASTPANAPRPVDTPGSAPANGLGRITRPILERYLYGVQTDTLAAAITDALAAGEHADPAAVLARAIGLVLGSPDFQRY